MRLKYKSKLGKTMQFDCEELHKEIYTTDTTLLKTPCGKLFNLEGNSVYLAGSCVELDSTTPSRPKWVPCEPVFWKPNFIGFAVI